MTGRVCRGGLYGYVFLIDILLGYSDGIMMGRVNGCEIGASYKDFLGNVEWNLAW